MAWQDRVEFVTDGQPVSAGVTNAAPETIDQNTRYLKSVIDALQLGSAVFAYDQPVESGALVGMALWYNPDTQQFERALAGTQTDPVSQLLVPTPASYVAGIVFAKSSATMATILVMGMVSGLDLTNSISDATPGGLYHLSTTTPGCLVSSAPPASVPVLWVMGQQVLVVPQIPDFLRGHQHYRFDLVASPAGDTSPPIDGGRHTIINPDASLPGWLPATNAVFNGLAPAGAVFGYNLSEAGPLKGLWPPVPLASVVLYWASTDNRVLGQVPPELILFDANGIWWMSDCHGEAPWPTELDTNSSLSESVSLGECPVPFEFRLVLYFTQLDFFTAQTVVTSLRSDSAALEITCLSTGEPAATGDLQATLNLAFLTGATDTAGSTVIKELDGETFNFGPVTEGIYTESDNVTLTSTVSRLLNPADDTSPTVHQGIINLSVSTDATLEIPIQLVRLDGVEEQYFQGVMYLGFPAGFDTSIRGKIRIPADISLSSPTAVIRLVLLGRSAGTLPALTMSYQRQARPTNGLVTPATLVTSDTALAVTTIAAVGANQYVEAVSAAFTVAAGDLVFFSISRADSDAYVGEVGLLDLSCLLAGG